MSIDIPFLTTLIVTGLVYLGLLIYILRLDEPFGVERWIAVYCLFSVAVAGAFTLSDTNTLLLGYPPGVWMALASVTSLCLLGAITFGYLELHNQAWWLVGIPVGATLILILDAQDPAKGLTELTWRAALSQPGNWFASGLAIAWVVVGLSLVALTYLSVTRASLPLLANRRFWWVIALLTIFTGEGIAMWAGGGFMMGGQGIRLAGVIIAVYAATNLELTDIRGVVRAVIGNALFIAVMALFIVAGIAAAPYLLAWMPRTAALISIGAFAILLALIYQQVRPAIHRVVNRAVFAAGYDTAQIVKGYSQRVANIIDIDELAVTVGITVAQAVQSSKLGLLLLTMDSDKTQVDVLIGAGKLPTAQHLLDEPSLFLKTLTKDQRPLSQYAIDYDPHLRAISADDREWLRSLGVDIYVPVFDGELLSAIMAVGARQSGDPYREAELDLLVSIAQQTSVALKNARLVANLRVLNEQMRDLYENSAVLNKNLGDSNERLRQMDKVKTDFINIASHELRTPLTTLRGFSDLLNDMTRSGNLDTETVEMATSQLSKASVRLEELLGQMLDVSQIDVEAMQLSFGPISLPAILQLSTNPYKAALEERGLTLTVHDLQNLPTIEGDQQRLVQTFRQLVGNAIKFTPDGGQIEVYANYLPPNEERDRPEAVELVIADKGVGINPEHYELIFEKFYRVGRVDLHSTGDTKFMGAGPGLGLTIARGVVKGHGGQIWVESDGFDPKTCPGSRFHVVLPVVHVTAPSTQPLPTPVAS
jgi:signal transduction histidine kinase